MKLLDSQVRAEIFEQKNQAIYTKVRDLLRPSTERMRWWKDVILRTDA